MDHGFSSNVGPVVEGAISAADKKNIKEETVKVIVSRSHSGQAKVEVRTLGHIWWAYSETRSYGHYSFREPTSFIYTPFPRYYYYYY